MTIECYVSACPFHSYHDEGPNQGPFCYHDECQVSPSYIETVNQYRPDQDGTSLAKEYAELNHIHPGIGKIDEFKRQYQDTDGSLKDIPPLHHYSVRYEWRIGEDGKTLASTVYFDAMGHQDAMKQFFAIYNGTKPLVSLTIKKSRP